RSGCDIPLIGHELFAKCRTIELPDAKLSLLHGVNAHHQGRIQQDGLVVSSNKAARESVELAVPPFDPQQVAVIEAGIAASGKERAQVRAVPALVPPELVH